MIWIIQRNGTTGLAATPGRWIIPGCEAIPIGPSETQNLPSLAVLLVEDHIPTRNAFQRTLTQWGHTVTGVNSAMEALAVLSEQPEVELMVTDWLMPEMDGLELTRLARRMERSRYLHIMVLTARTGKHDPVEALNAGADSFLPKSFDLAELKAHTHAVQRNVMLEQKLVERTAELSRQLAQSNALLEDARECLESVRMGLDTPARTRVQAFLDAIAER